MTPFGIPTIGFCLACQCAILIFSPPGTIFGTLDRKFGPRRVPAGPVFVCSCGRHGLPQELMWICATGLDCMVPRRPLDKPISPQPPPENNFIGIFPVPEKLLGVPVGPWRVPYWSLKRAVAYFATRSPVWDTKMVSERVLEDFGEVQGSQASLPLAAGMAGLGASRDCQFPRNDAEVMEGAHVSTPSPRTRGFWSREANFRRC